MKAKKREPRLVLAESVGREYLTLAQVQVLLGISEATLHRRFRDGSLKSRKFGGRTYVHRADFDAALGVQPGAAEPTRRGSRP